MMSHFGRHVVLGGGGGGGGGGGSPNILYRISHQATSGPGLTYPISHGANLASNTDLSILYVASGPGAQDGVRVWNWEHVGDGSWGGENFMRFTRWSGVDGGPETGWGWDPNILISPTTFASLAPGPFSLRFVMRVQSYLGYGNNPTDVTAAGQHAAGMKWFIFGGPGISGERRMIFWLRNGLAYNQGGEFLEGQGGTLAGHTVIDASAGVGPRTPLLITNAGDKYVQVYWAYEGYPGGAFIKIYVNNNDINAPNAQRTDFSGNPGGQWLYPESWSTGHWGDIVTDNSSSDRNAIFDFKNMELGTAFHPTWFPG